MCPRALQAARRSTTNGETSTPGDRVRTVDSEGATAAAATEVTAREAAEAEALGVAVMAGLEAIY
jgi:hypothetical protein